MAPAARARMIPGDIARARTPASAEPARAGGRSWRGEAVRNYPAKVPGRIRQGMVNASLKSLQWA
eukprot:1881839-Pyramimonas_sp.AAC.1